MNCKYFKLIPSANSSIILFSFTFVLSGVLGIIMISYSTEIVSYSERFDDISACENSYGCTISFKLDEDIEGPVYFYYRYKGYY